MRSAILALVTTAVGALAQVDHAISGFVYLGCVRAPLSGTTFSSSISPSSSSSSSSVASFFPLDPEACQRACPDDTTVVAVGLGRCHCIQPGGGRQQASHFDFERVAEDRCDVSCFDDGHAPWCGGAVRVNGAGVDVVPYNVYLASGWGLARRTTPTPVAAVPTPVATPQRNSTGGGGGGSSGDGSSGSGDKGNNNSGSDSGDSGSGSGSGSNNDAVISAGFRRLSGSFAAIVGGSLGAGLMLVGF